MNDNLQKFFKNTALYMSASMDIATSFKLARRRTKHKKLGMYLDASIGILLSGVSVSESLKILKDKGHLDAVSWSILTSAEQSGLLKEAFERISQYLATSARLKKSIMSSVAYPSGVVLSAVCMVYFLISVIFPKIIPLFSSMRVPIPPTTQFLITLSYLLKMYSLYASLLCAACIALAIYLYKTKLGFKRVMQGICFKIPFLRQILFSKESHRIGLSCGILMKSGANLTESLALSHRSCSFLNIKDFLSRIIEAINQGKKMSDILPQEKMFQGEWVDLVTIGEMTGTLPESFSEIAKCYEIRLKEDLELLARWSEPVALGLSASIILLVAMSVIQPMYAVIQYVHA